MSGRKEIIHVMFLLLVSPSEAFLYFNPCRAEADSKYRPCIVNGVCYKDGELTGDPCGRCWCVKGYEVCVKMHCRWPKPRCSATTFWRYSSSDLCTVWSCNGLTERCQILECDADRLVFQDCLA